MRSLIYDLNGNYVIFKMLETYDKQKMEFLIPLVEESVLYIFIKTVQLYGLVNIWLQDNPQNHITIHITIDWNLD
jgi:pumilio RNA-binding family